MGYVRALTRDDIRQVADLHEGVLSGGRRTASEGARTYLKEVFFCNPWYDPDIPSLVYEHEEEIVGFLGVVPRPMAMNGRRVQAAISTHFVVEPGKRNTLAGVQLLRTFLSGPQDLSLAEGNSSSRRIWERLGGSTSLVQSIHVTSLLRPARYVALQMGKQGWARPFTFASTPFCGAVDGLAARVPGSPVRQAGSRLSAEEASLETLLSCLSQFSACHALRPVYDQRSLGWLLGILEMKRAYGRLRKVVLRDGDGRVAGWYLYYPNPGRNSQVAQVWARDEAFDQVLDHLLHDAWARGACSLTGRLEARFAKGFARKCTLLNRDSGWMLVQSREPQVVGAIQRGDAFLTRLEAEWWIPHWGDNVW